MGDVADDVGEAGWTLVQVTELARRAEQLLLDSIALFGPHAHAAMAGDATIALGAAEMRRVAESLTESAEIAEQLELLAARLPDHDVEAHYGAVRAAAAADLATGIVDPHRVLLAARLLDVEGGWPALAASLVAGDVVAAWDCLTVAELLGRFRGSDPRTVAQVLDEAGLAPETPFASCMPPQLVALAAGLRRHADGRPA